MKAMTQAKADTSARPRTVCECRTRDRYGALVEFPTITALAIHCSFEGRERHDEAGGGEQEKTCLIRARLFFDRLGRKGK